MDIKGRGDQLDKLEKKLYNKDTKFIYGKQRLKKKKVEDVESGWRDSVKTQPARSWFGSSFLVKLFVASVVFFVAAAGIAFYRLFIEPARWTPDAIAVDVEGPTSVSGGEEEQFRVRVRNGNDVVIESAKLSILFPEGAIAPGVQAEGQYRHLASLGPIIPGEEVTETVEAALFGEENTEKDFTISLEYRVEGSSGTFSKEKVYTVLLSTSPVSITLDMPTEANAGEEIRMGITLRSNVQETLPGTLLRVEYPFGFSFARARPEPVSGNNVWDIGDLKSSDMKQIEVFGTLEGFPEDQKTFRVFVGREQGAQPNQLGLVYNSLIRTVPIARSFVALALSINGDTASPEVVIPSGGKVDGAVTWSNNLSARIVNGEIILRLRGEPIDRTGIRVNKGFYRSGDDVIIWNQTTDRSLAVIEPGGSGSGSFSFDTTPLLNAGRTLVKNPEIFFELEFRGERAAPGAASESVTVTASRKIKVQTETQVASYALHASDDAFVNSGPYPPQADTETTFTIVWSVVNSSNRIQDARMTASIPIYVRWIGSISGGETVLYNDLNGNIAWEIDEIPAGGPAREVRFQIGVTPSANQVGGAPQILSGARFEGTDMFTGTTITQNTLPLTTNLPRDPIAAQGRTGGRVVP